jgi:hypothetical protein
MALEYRELTCEQRTRMFDDILALLKEEIPLSEIKSKIMADYKITDIWTRKSRWDIVTLEDFINKIKGWSEMKISAEDLLC